MNTRIERQPNLDLFMEFAQFHCSGKVVFDAFNLMSMVCLSIVRRMLPCTVLVDAWGVRRVIRWLNCEVTIFDSCCCGDCCVAFIVSCAMGKICFKVGKGVSGIDDTWRS